MKRNPKKTTAFRRSLITGICLLLILFSVMQTAFADEGDEGVKILDPVKQSGAYSAVLYDNTNGLPTAEANAIATTDEGFIWIGSYSGLIRYDGNTFERISPDTGISSVVSLFTDSKNRLWIGMNDSGLAMMDRGEIKRWDEGSGLGSGKVRDITEDKDGNIYVGTAYGISVILPDLTVRRIVDPQIADAYIEHLVMGEDGLLYCLTNEDDFFILEDGELKEYISHTKSRIQGITSILADPDEPGKLYFGTENSELYHGDLVNGSDRMEYTDISPLFNVINTQKVGDKVWIMANNGIGCVDEEGFHDFSDLPMNNSVGGMMADYEGNLWFTSSRQGVMKLVPNRFQDVNEYFGLEDMVVNSTCAYENMLFIATDTGLTVLTEDGAVDSLPLTEAKTAGSGESLGSYDLIDLLDGCRIRSIIRDSKDRLWISTWRGPGLLRYDHGSVVSFGEPEGLLSNHIRTVWEADDGSMIVAHTGGGAVIKDDEVAATFAKGSGLANLEILSVSSAPNGDILLGSNGGGIYVINDERTRTIGETNGLSSEIVMKIKRDDKRNIFWLVTGDSLAYMDYNYKVTTIAEFPYFNNFDLYENSKGEMWVLSSDGIYIVPTDELVANGEILAAHYGLENGLPCTTTSNSFSELTPEGYLYISGNTGVVRVNIEDTKEDVRDLKLAIPFVEADGKLIYPDNNGFFTIPYSTLKLTVHAYIFNYSLTDPIVSYRLEGLDPEPTTLKRSELGPVTYTNLKGKTYVFNLSIKGSMGSSSTGTAVTIVKEKAIYEKPWFFVSLGLGLITGLALLIRNYVRWLMADMEQKHKEEQERQRLMGELTMASSIQLGVLPHDFPPFPDRKEFDIYASTEPARDVGGDFYDFFFVDEDHLCIVMADVSGKGIPAALFMMISKSLLKSFANMGKSAAEVLERANDSLCADNKMDMFVTAWLGILEISTGKLVAANAGHEYPVIGRSGRRFEIIKDKHGLVMGGMEGMAYKEYELDLSPGDKLFLYTDGIPEATNSDKNMFGTDLMLKALNADTEASPEKVLDNVRQAVDDFVKDAEQFDDITMLCLEYHGPKQDSL